MNVCNLPIFFDFLQHCKNSIGEPTKELAWYQIFLFFITGVILFIFFVQIVLLITCSKKLTVDKYLKLSHPNFNKIIEESVRHIQNIELSPFQKLNFLNRNPYPDEGTLVRLASKVYREEKDGRPVADKKMPNGWQLHDTCTNGYFGAAYWNSELQQIVVAHRGTKNVGAVIVDVIGVIYHNYASQVKSAVTFADMLKSIVRKHNEKHNCSIHLTFTGHSLGGWLAQITTFTTKYLTVKDASFFAKDSTNTGYHSHTVAFDSPGCRRLLQKLKNDHDVRYAGFNSLSITNLDITCFLSAPNLVNNYDLHVGTIYRMYIDDYPFRRFLDLINYTKKTHSIKSIVKALTKDNYKKMLVVDWPLTEQGIQEVMFFAPLKKLFGIKNEYEDFHNTTNQTENYDPNTPNAGPDSNNRYRVHEVNDAKVQNSVFTDREIDLLIKFKDASKYVSNFALSESISSISDENTASEIIASFTNAKIERKEVHSISKEDILKLVRYLKNIDRFFPKFINNITLHTLVQYETNISSFLPKFGDNTQKRAWFGVRQPTWPFVERKFESNRITSALDQGKRVLLYGVGGVGKTELAVQYAHEHSESYNRNVVWINCETNETVTSSLCKFLRELHLKTKNKDGEVISNEAMMKQALQWLSNRRVLFIFDNAENHKVFSEILPPADSNYKVLITTQRGNLFTEHVKAILIPPLDEENALHLLKTSLYLKDNLYDEDLKKLSINLGYLPLTLQLAISYITQMGGISYINKYVNAFSSNILIQSLINNRGFDNYGKTINYVIKTAIEKIRLEKAGKLAERILFILSYLNPEVIDTEIFTIMAMELLHLPKNKTNSDKAATEIDLAIQLLTQYSLITAVNMDEEEKPLRKLTIHRLVQEVVHVDVIQNYEEDILRDALKLAVQRKENYHHLKSIWNYAKEYKGLINYFISAHLDRLIHFHLVIENCSYETIDKILTTLKVSELKELLNTQHPETGYTAMHRATTIHNENLLYPFVRCGGDLNSTAKEHGLRPIHTAAIANNLCAIRFLAYYGVNIKIQDDRGWTPLHYAVKRGSIEAITALLAFRAGVNATNQNKQTPAHIAAMNSNLEAMKLLTEKGAALNVKDTFGWTVLHYASDNGNLDVIKYIVDKAVDVNPTNKSGKTPIFLAIANIDAIKLLVSKGADLNVRDNDGWTLLHHAEKNKAGHVIKFLVYQSVNVSATNNFGKAPDVLQGR